MVTECFWSPSNAPQLSNGNQKKLVAQKGMGGGHEIVRTRGGEKGEDEEWKQRKKKQ
jgi:hypothetical protein